EGVMVAPRGGAWFQGSGPPGHVAATIHHRGPEPQAGGWREGDAKTGLSAGRQSIVIPMRRPSLLRRLIGLLVGATLLLSLAAPARAQFDPVTMSLMLGAVQLVGGVAAAIGLGMAQDGNKQGIAMPNGVPCGLQDGVPQICWQPHNGGFEGSPHLPTGAKPFTPPPSPPPPPPGLEGQAADPPNPNPSPGPY